MLISKHKTAFRRFCDESLFRLFVRGVLVAVLAELIQFQASLDGFLVFARVIIRGFTHGTLEFYEIVLRHKV